MAEKFINVIVYVIMNRTLFLAVAILQ